MKKRSWKIVSKKGFKTLWPVCTGYRAITRWCFTFTNKSQKFLILIWSEEWKAGSTLGPPSDFETRSLESILPPPHPIQIDGEEIKFSKRRENGGGGNRMYNCVSGGRRTNFKVNFVDWNNKLNTNTYLIFAFTRNHTKKYICLFSSLYIFFRQKLYYLCQY